MREIITDLAQLTKPAEPLKFIKSNGDMDKAEGEAIIKDIKEVMDLDKSIIAISAPQLGIDKRIFGIRFGDEVKVFINPIITKKSNHKLAGETCASMPGKEILITRPEEVTVVYYTEEFKYEDNKLLGPAARLFDQQAQFLDGVTPAELGLVSDIELDGSLADLSEEDIKKVIEIYKQYIGLKTKALEASIEEADEVTKDQYKKLKFTEKVINGEVQVVANNDGPQVKMNRAQRRATEKMKKKYNPKKGHK